MKNSEVLQKINEYIVEEKGRKVTMESKFLDAGLDSLGSMIFFLNLAAEFPIFDGIPEDDQLASLDIPNLTIRDLVHKCRLSITKESQEPSDETKTDS
jgi:acyl carrier protein